MAGDFGSVRRHLKDARARRGWTQERLAEAADVEVQLVSDLETRRRKVTIPGDGKSPEDWDRFSRVCRALGEDPVVILKAQGLM